jgi:hypothetical protein
MKKYTFDDIRSKGLLIYEYIRGSTLYGTNIESSDIDTSGIFLAPVEQILGLGLDYQEIIADDRNDNTWYEMTKYMRMLLKSNPTVLESLFIPEDKIIGNVDPIMQLLLDNRDQFVSKECFSPFGGYAIEQIKKMRGLNKKIVNPVTERSQPLDFTYTFYKQGSTKINNWLEYRGLKQEYCGLVHIPNMHEVYGVYYDWGAHMKEFNLDNSGITDEIKLFVQSYNELVSSHVNWDVPPIGYRGMITKNSNELRLSSVSKGETPICYITYNQSGYVKHCKDYKEYQDWVKFRNPARYESNLNKNYDSKNALHCFRMMAMATEIANGEGVLVDRTNIDRQFLLDVRNHKFEYDYIVDLMNIKKSEMNLAIENSTIKEQIDVNFVNELLIQIRKMKL